jgi:hypothetical protein
VECQLLSDQQCRARQQRELSQRAFDGAPHGLNLRELGFFPWLNPVTPNRLLHCIAGPAIAVRPEWALRAGLSFGVIDPLLMRAAYDSIRHDD